jgi:hypothetical protein
MAPSNRGFLPKLLDIFRQRLIKKRNLLVLLFLVFSFWPIKTKQLPLAPSFAKQEFGFGDIKPWSRGINRHSPANFKMIVGLDFAENTSISNSMELENFAGKMTLQQLQSRAQAYPWRYTKSVAIPIATFNRENSCKLRMVLDDKDSSQPIDCSDIHDNQLTSFHFSGWIKPGLYSARLESTAEPGNEVAPYFSEDKHQQPWILPFQGQETVNFWQYFIALAYRNPWAAAAHGCTLFLVLMLIQKKERFPSKIVFFSSILFVSLSTFPFSGFDETAHLSMYREALKARNLTIESDESFNRNVWRAMAESDFFRLHSVESRISNECPHSIIGHCGITDPPIKLYTLYVRILAFFGATEYAPLGIIRTAMVINIFLIIVLVCIARSFLNSNEMAAFYLSLSFLGGMVAQLPSLTNDFPMFILGGFGLLSAVSILQKPILKGLGSFFMAILIFMIVQRFDLSSLSFAPFLCVLFLLLLARWKLLSKQYSNPPQTSLRLKAFLDFLGLFLYIIGFVYIVTILVKIPAIVNILSMLDERTLLLGDIQRIDSHKSAGILISYWKSIFGSYVWGHSYWPDAFYGLSVSGYLVASYLGLLLLKSRTTPWHYYTVASILGAVVAFQIVIVLGIASGPSFSDNQIFRESYTKVRLSAPIATAALILPALSGAYIARISGESKFLRLWMIILFLSYALLLPTKFFFADIF